jgi:hypothetical protein
VHQNEVADVVTTSAENSKSESALTVGTKVSVRNRFLREWTSGFQVAAVLTDGYRIRRLADDHVFPDVFPFDDVRLERRRPPLREISGTRRDRRH